MLSPLASSIAGAGIDTMPFWRVYGYLQAPNIILQLKRCRAGESEQFSSQLKISAKAIILFFSFYSLTTDFYPINCSCPWHYSELPTLSPITIPIAAVPPPGHTWRKAAVSDDVASVLPELTMAWPTCHFALHYKVTCCPLSFLDCTLFPSMPLNLWVWSYFSSQMSSRLFFSPSRFLFSGI